MTPLDLEVTDDSGFMALVDPDAYEGYVSENWELEQLLAKFGQQMASRRLLIWGTGSQCVWCVQIRAPGPPPLAFRSCGGTICSSRGRLLLTNYESLSMAAQFEDVTLPERYQAALVFEVPPGLHRCVVHQLRDPDLDDDEADGPGFILDVGLDSDLVAPWTSIPWFVK